MMRPHVVIVCLDSVRKDFYDEFATRIRSQADIRFENMRAAASWSVPSHAAMITGELPHQTGVHTFNRDFTTLDPADTWLSNLDAYETVGVSGNIFAGPLFGFDTFFDRFYPISASGRFPEGMDLREHIRNRDPDEGMVDFFWEALRHDSPTRTLLNGALFKIHTVAQRVPIRNPFDYGAKSISRQITRELEDSSRPTLIFSNFMDAHGPHSPFRKLDSELYDCPASFTSLDIDEWDITTSEELGGHEQEVRWVRQLYAAEIAYLDSILSDMVGRITHEVDRNVVFIVTSDHGENLGYDHENHMMGHMCSLSEGLLHVPFDIIVSQGEESSTVTDRASLLDLGRIVNRLVAGKSITDLTRETAPAEIAGSGSELPDGPHQNEWDRAMRAIYDGGHKFVRCSVNGDSVYAISDEAGYQEEIDSVDFRDLLFEDTFDNSIGEFFRSARENSTSTDVDEVTEQRLEDLGYL